jgi:hypothetical protein
MTAAAPSDLLLATNAHAIISRNAKSFPESDRKKLQISLKMVSLGDGDDLRLVHFVSRQTLTRCFAEPSRLLSEGERSRYFGCFWKRRVSRLPRTL